MGQRLLDFKGDFDLYIRWPSNAKDVCITFWEDAKRRYSITLAQHQEDGKTCFLCCSRCLIVL